jgi:hypothetical protein
MANEFEKVLEEIGKGIEWPFKHAAEVIEILTTSLKDEPAVQAALIGLVKEIEQVGKDSATALAARGLNVPDDIQAVNDGKALWAYVQGTFLPAVEGAYKDLQKDTDPAAAPVAETAAPATAETATP